MEDPIEEVSSINKLLHNYFQGIYEGSVDLLNTIYHPCTLLFGDINGQQYRRTLVLYLDGVAHRTN
jgi:hypothetical protein